MFNNGSHGSKVSATISMRVRINIIVVGPIQARLNPDNFGKHCKACRLTQGT